MPKSVQVNNNCPITPKTSSFELLDILLKNRGIKNTSEFLSPPFPISPFTSETLQNATDIIHQVIKNDGNILIYGDYDVDGVTATAILWQSLYKLTKKVIPFVPHRQKDGYGIKADSFFRLQKEKNITFDLLITVDNGIVADTELKKIKERQKIQIIVTDHHLPHSQADFKIADVTLHTTQVSGAAVSWFLAKELDSTADLGLSALGAIADCLPLLDLNRSIVVHGLSELQLNPSPGIKKLAEISGLKPGQISEYEVGFILGPRINAIGRLSDPTDALRLLCSQNPLQAARYASLLNSYNQDRQVLQKDMFDLADKNIDAKNKIIVKSDSSFNAGIIGLIASRLTEKYYLPSIVMAIDGDIAKGSCRSIPELNIIDTLRQHQDLFIDLGGHPGAAGFSISSKNISKLEKAIIKTVKKLLLKKNLKPHLDVDAVMDLSAVTVKNINTIQKMSPFGIGNPEPLFLFKNLKIVNKKILGSTGDHLKFQLQSNQPQADNFGSIEGLAFKKGELFNTLNIGGIIDVAASLSLNKWAGRQIPQLIIKEIIAV